MFSCLWPLWDWFDPSSMENRKKTYINTTSTPNSDSLASETAFNHKHQHPSTRHLHLVQNGLKIPNYEHAQLNQSSPYQNHLTHLIPEHQHSSQSLYQHCNANTTNLYQNPLVLHHQFPHNHQQKYLNHPNDLLQHQGHFHYQSNPQKNPHTHNLNQKNAVVWVPHQASNHYHPQMQPLEKSKQPIKSYTVLSHISKLKEGDRKHATGNQQLRSPPAKRPIDAPVKLQGWLHKQGSDGLMLWKRRWFVLSEYCVFYYKGSEEEKVLGSILLPSYKVSICEPNDKVSRKFAFKCEHTNMRTYVLAADSHEHMIQWVTSLSMACLLQTSNEGQQHNQLSATSKTEISVIQLEQQNKNIRSTPTHIHTSSNATDMSNPSQQELSQYLQPLYANAPPKPRRLTDGYISPSSEEMEKHFNQSKLSANQKFYQPAHLSHEIQKSSANLYGKLYDSRQHHQQAGYQICNKHLQISECGPIRDKQNFDRRTPDTYGRSKSCKGNCFSDYEDIYTENYIYKRPLSPLSYSNSKINPAISVVRPYTPLSMHSVKNIAPLRPGEEVKLSNSIRRPHSADFLDYEVKHQSVNAVSKQPRPKSSLDINRNGLNDHYFYSEEYYAEKMRKSAQYLSNMSKYTNYQSEPAPTPAFTQTPCHSFETDNTFPLLRSNTQPSTNLHQFPYEDSEPVRSRNFTMGGLLSTEFHTEIQNKTHQHFSKDNESAELHNKHSMLHQHYQDLQKPQEYDTLTRSASACLPQNESHIDIRSSNRDGGERKREESMKRLLEWKQRMLQSPLNRKINSSIHTVHTKYNPYCENIENRYCTNFEMDSDNLRYKSYEAQYNSYSSDDEESGSISIAMRDTVPRVVSSKKSCASYARPTQSKSSSSINIMDESMISHIPHLRNGSHGPNQQDSSDTSQSSTSYRSRLPKMDASRRLENLQKLEQIKQHLLELEKQYEKGKPLVNLVDNMVKLGSLYKFPKGQGNNLYVKDKLEFNQQMQEQRLLAQERRDWIRLSPNHSLLQTKVHQLYELDQLIQEESQTLHGLQQDKEEIEKALAGLRQRLVKGFKDPAEIEHARKQQIILEKELSRIHFMLAQNSRKLEQTIAGNARLEQELLVLKQKLQITKQQRSSPQTSNAGDSLPCVIGTSAMLETDLYRAQQKVGNLQRQRQELSMQVRQLTDRSNNLQQMQISTTNALSFPQINKKKTISLWRETDLDNMTTVDYGGSLYNLADSPTPWSPLYINTKHHHYSDMYINGSKSSDSTSDDTLFTQAPPTQEKQEIKTVRIVKRESERRQRDRESTTSGKWDTLVEEETPYNPNVAFCVQNITDSNCITPCDSKCDASAGGMLNRPTSISSTSSQQLHAVKRSITCESSELSPIFKSEAAKQIINEMSIPHPKFTNRRAIPKEKRRHYTAPHNSLIMKSLSQLPTDDTSCNRLLDVNIGRARDDMDMERALRQQVDAPDVVRSTLSTNELKYNESTIDNILGKPNKIFIPERYIPEELPQLSVEEQQYRLRKVESIKKMLSGTTIISSSTGNLASEETDSENTSNSANKNTSKILEERKEREHLLQLNQILAKQVMEMSKIVAGSSNAEE